MHPVLIATVFGAIVVFASHTNNFRHTLNHHSSASDAAHRQDHSRTGNWLVFGVDKCDDHFRGTIELQLSAGRLTVAEHRSGTCVLSADSVVDPNQLATVLLSEQRGNRLTGFHRERVTKYTSH